MEAKNLFSNLKTDEEHRKALDTFNLSLLKTKQQAKISSITFKIVVFFGILQSLIGSMMYALSISTDAEDQVVLQSIPKVLKSFLTIFCGFWNLLYKLCFRFIDKEIISLIVVNVLLLIVIPLIIGLIVKIIFNNKKPKSTSDNLSIKEYYANTYKLFTSGKTYIDFDDLFKAKWPAYFAVILSIVLFLFLSIKAGQFDMSGKMLIYFVIGIVVAVFGASLIFRILFAISKPAFIPKNNAIIPNRVDFENAYADYDEEFKKELIEARRKAEEDRRREEAAAARRRELEERKPKIRFDASRVSSANTFTVYIDDEKVDRFDGGRIRTVSVPEGYHKMQVQVYNDASETASWMEPAYEDFEPYKVYDVDYT